MSDINRLEAYFDRLLQTTQYDSDTELTDEETRFEYYEKIKEIAGELASGKGGGYRVLAEIDNVDLDYLIRSVVIERVMANGGLAHILQAVLDLIEGESDSDEQLRDYFDEAARAIVAKDKKMIEILRQMDLSGLGNSMEKAVGRINVKPKGIDSIIKEGKRKDYSSGVEREK